MFPLAAMPQGRVPMLFLALGTLLSYHSAGLYRPRLHLSVLADLPVLSQRALMSTLAVTAAVSILELPPGPGVFLEWALLGLFLALALRGVAYLLVRWARASGKVGYRTLIVGGGHVGQQLARTLRAEPAFGLRVVGIVDDDPLTTTPAGARLGSLQEVPGLLRAHAVDVLVVAFGSHSEQDVVEVLRSSEDSGSEVFIVPRLFEVHSLRGHGDHIHGVPMVRLRRPHRARASRRLKRLFDITASATALLVLAPLLAVIALAVRREGGAGILFRQTRVGRDAREFQLLKFRSLKPVDEAESATQWNVAHDSRIGSVGRFLRRTSLDELPQFWNVLRGDMSIVGPRPERPHFVAAFGNEIPRYAHRHRVPCGLTGLAQVNGLRGDTSIADRARFDNYYIENWSLYLDIKILFLTFREVLSGRGR